MCTGCHGIPGYQASFPEVHKVPMIGGQNAKYIMAALLAYQKGERKHPTMQGIAASLNEQDMATIAQYYADQGSKTSPPPQKSTTPSPAVQALLTKGNCLACHGEGLNHPIDGAYPKLAGQHADYLYVALKAYQTTDNSHVGRSNPIMGAQAKPFSHAELKQLATYVSSLPGELRTVTQAKFR